MRKLSVALFIMALTMCTSVHTAELKEPFSFGINYAWKNYSGDFGGIGPWAKQGVASNPDVFEEELNDMAAHGVQVVRWWVWPEFWTDAITFDENGSPNPLAQDAIDDALKALELVDAAGMRVMFCIFSFDGFRETRERFGITMTGYHDIVVDDDKRAALMTNVVRPLISALADSPHASALHSWDVINEPEWAMTGANKYGGDKFEPNHDLQPVTHDQMEVFVGDTIKIMREETPDVPVTVGNAAVKRLDAWQETDLDFYQPHIYDWVNAYWPYTSSPTQLGYGDKPMIMGEYPAEGLQVATQPTMLNSWFNNGYAGSLAWDYRITHVPTATEEEKDKYRRQYLTELREFAAANNIGSLDDAVPFNPGAPAAAKQLPLSRPDSPSIQELDN